MLLCEDGKLFSILFFKPVHEVFIREFFETQTEISLEEDAFDKVYF